MLNFSREQQRLFFDTQINWAHAQGNFCRSTKHMLKAISGKGHVVYCTVIYNARLLQLVPLNDHKRKQNNLSLKFIIYWIKRMKRKSGKVHAQSFNNKKKQKKT